MLLWDRERAPEVVRAWAQWSRTAPDAVTTAPRVMSLPPLPELPPFLRGRQLVVMDGAVLADDASAEALLAPWASGTSVLNFTEERTDTSTAYDNGAWERLRTIRSSVDPDGLFAANHPVPGHDRAAV